MKKPSQMMLKLAVGVNPEARMVVMQLDALTMAPNVARDFAAALIQSAAEAESLPANLNESAQPAAKGGGKTPDSSGRSSRQSTGASKPAPPVTERSEP